MTDSVEQSAHPSDEPSAPLKVVRYISPEQRAELAQKKRLWERRKHHTSEMSLIEMQEREETAKLNRDAMTELMKRHNLIIPARDFHNWRPTLRVSGDINGVVEGVTIIATNGLLGYFLTTDEESFYGHVQLFSGDVKPLFSLPKPAKTKTARPKRTEKSKRQQILDAL